jgi:organic radical activating enzyme
MGGKEVSVKNIAEDYKSKQFLDGITLSGGEPFAQQKACVELLKLLPGVNVWIYTGYEYEEIQHTELANLADVLVVGRFVEALKCEGEFYGSHNQRIIRKGEGMDILEKAIETYGKDMQLNVAVEELSELIKEICKNKRGENNRDNIIEEMADCCIMLEQLVIIYNIKEAEIDRVMDEKLSRLEDRLEKGDRDE